MMEEIALLALTKMISGFCIAGVRLSDKAWVRPVKQFGNIVLSGITYPDKQRMAIGDVVALNLLKARPQPPHVEDWVCEFVRQRPQLVRRLDAEEWRELLAGLHETSPEEVLQEQKRSLCLYRPDMLRATFFLDGYSNKYESRIWFPGCPNNRGLPCTDLKWRAFGRRLLEGRTGHLTLDGDALVAKMGTQAVYLVLGLARSFEGQNWPLVVGVLSVPDYRAAIDYSNP